MSTHLALIASAEMDLIWLIIGFFVIVSVSAGVALYVILRQNSFAAPTRFLQGAMMVLLLKTMLISLIIAIGLYRLNASTDHDPDPTPNEEPVQERNELYGPDN